MKAFNIIGSYFVFSAKKQIAYRIFIISELVGSVAIPILLNLFLWNTLLADNAMQYTFPQMVQYIILSNLVLIFTQASFERRMERDIKTYKLGYYLLRPVNYIADVLLSYINSSLIRLIIIYIPLFLIMQFVIGTWQNVHLLACVCSLIVAFSLNALISFIIGTAAFWLTEIWGISALRVLITGLFAGTLFPLDILNPSLLKIMMLTPFPYMAYIPTKLLVGSETTYLQYFAYLPISCGWLLLLFVIALIMWSTGVKKYTSSGA